MKRRALLPTVVVASQLVAASAWAQGTATGRPVDRGVAVERQAGDAAGLALGTAGPILVLSAKTEVRSSSGASFSESHERLRRARPSPTALTPQGLVF
jgi:hypothetical protein